MEDSVAIKQAVNTIGSLIKDPSKGLPEGIFLLVSRLTPMINVDLLLKNKRGQTLLTWRDDGYWKAGWHVPGGIIRYKETIEERIQAVAKAELGAEVEFLAIPLAFNEIIHQERRDRGHFISLLYQCSLTTPPDESLRYRSGRPRPNQWKWHTKCPENIIKVHEIYRKYI